MKYPFLNFWLAPIAVTCLVSCAGDELTSNKAQEALDEWISRREGEVSVVGVQEIPEQNVATATLEFRNLQWTSSYFGIDQDFTGTGYATFTYFNDGRWVLSRVETSDGLNSTWWDDINIQVK